MKEITEEVLLSLGFTKKSKSYCKNIGKEKIYKGFKKTHKSLACG